VDRAPSSLRILEVCNDFPPTVGGSETHNASEVEFLRRRGHQVCVVVPRAPEAMRSAGYDESTIRRACEPAWSWSVDGSVPVYNIRETGRSTVGPLYRMWRRLSRRYGPFDVVVVHRAHHVPAFFRASRLVLTLHYMEMVCPMTFIDYQACGLEPSGRCACYATRSRWRNAKWHARQRITRRLVDAVVTKYPHIHEKLLHSGVPADKLHRVPNWIDAGGFGGRRVRWPSMPDDLPAFGRDASCVFGYLGRLSPDKSTVAMLDAFLRVARNLDGARLLIVGDGEERAALERMTAASGLTDRVRFIGSIARRDVPAALSFFDCGLKVSAYDNFSWSLLELMAAGLPVIATAEPGTDGLMVDGETAFLCDPSPTSIAAAMERAFQQPELRRRVGDQARRTIERDYSQRNLLRYEAVLTGDNGS
jgi:glycosyltransferase involved in cell wall biosynthesis